MGSVPPFPKVSRGVHGAGEGHVEASAFAFCFHCLSDGPEATGSSVATILALSLLLVSVSFVYTSARFDAIRRAVYKLLMATEASYLQAASGSARSALVRAKTKGCRLRDYPQVVY